MSQDTADRIGKFYDSVTDPYVRAWNGNLHMGYVDSETAPVSVETATERLTAEVLDRLRVEPGATVLDVGCGIGKPALRLARDRGVEVAGVSISEQQIAVATGSAEAAGLADVVRFQVADARNLPFPDQTFDAVFSLEVLHHVDDRSKALREIARVVKPGGSVVIADFALRGPVPAADRPLVEEFAAACNLVTLTEISTYAADCESAGLADVITVDISAHVRPSMSMHAEAMRAARGALGPIVGAEQLDRMVDLTDRYAALPQFGYAIFVAEGA